MTKRWVYVLVGIWCLAGAVPTTSVRANEAEVSGGRADFPPGPARELERSLARIGISPSLTYIAESAANLSGGLRRGAIYQGRLDLGLSADLDKLMGWSGAKFHANVMHIHGDSLSRQYIGNFMSFSGTEALNHARLYELWIEQEFAKGYSLRVGQLSADVEFFNSKYSDVFVNATFGWPAIAAVNLPSGGPASGLTAFGFRAKAQLSDRLTLLFAMFNGDPAGRGPGEAQNRNAHGLNFRVNDTPLLMGELQYSYEAGPRRPGTLKLGGWFHTDRFDDQRYGTDGLSLADPAGNGEPAQRRGSFAPYAVIEQMLVPFDGKGDQGIAAFARIAANQPDRNLIDFYADAGLNVSGFWPARPNDKFGVGFAYAKISSSARGLDQDALGFGTPGPVRNYEAAFELSYLAEVKKGWTVQPTLQYLIHPSGGASNPFTPNSQRIPNAIAVGMRMTMKWGQREPDAQQ